VAEPAADPNAAAAAPAAPAYSTQASQMLRTVQSNTLRLSQMADQKASILMGAAFVVFSLSVGQALGGRLPWSLAILAVFAFLSSLCAVFAVLPRAGASRGAGARPNPLFFGHFHDRDEEEWTGEVLDAVRTDEGVYRAMLHDIYQNGQVLQHRKYRFLGYAYRLFIAGLVITLVAFAIEFAFSYA
jgi:ABC-type transport system involved in cytochrome c biogenesis permease subunit